jgi:hypothetical protein
MNKEDGFGNHRSPEAQRYDAFCDQAFRMEKAAERLMDGGQHQTVLHRTEGMGYIGVICASVCVMCVVVLIVGAILIVPELHDLRAWKDIHAAKIAKLEAQQSK